MLNSTRFGSTSKKRSSAGVRQAQSPLIQALTKTLFPEPVVPATRRCGGISSVRSCSRRSRRRRGGGRKRKPPRSRRQTSFASGASRAEEIRREGLRGFFLQPPPLPRSRRTWPRWREGARGAVPEHRSESPTGEFGLQLAARLSCSCFRSIRMSAAQSS